jgi:pimeloyl-ACP methyl ester carboxylesterase
MSLDEMADEAVARMQGRFDVLGVAMGSIVAQHVLVRHPERVRSALLACAGARSRREVMLTRAAAVEREGMEAVTPATLERWFTPEALTAGGHPGVAYARRVLLRMDPAALADAWLAISSHDVIEQLRAVEAPTTLVAGARDQSVPVAALEPLRERLPRTRLEILPGPHMIHLEEPAALSAALDRHLLWVSSGAEPRANQEAVR